MLEYQHSVFWKLLCAELHCCLSSDIIIDGLCNVLAASIQNDLDQDHFNQEFQDAIDVIQRHSSELQLEPGMGLPESPRCPVTEPAKHTVQCGRTAMAVPVFCQITAFILVFL